MFPPRSVGRFSEVFKKELKQMRYGRRNNRLSDGFRSVNRC